MSKLTNEECWVIVGKQSDNHWRGRRTRYSVGEPASVNFNPKWVEDREDVKGDVVGFVHTHPATKAEPSRTDYATMKAWVMYFGRPMLCMIKGTDGLRAWWFVDHELDTDPVECSVKSFGPFYRGDLPSIKHWAPKRKPTTMRFFLPMLYAGMNTHLVLEENRHLRAWIDPVGKLSWTEEKAREHDPELWEFFDSIGNNEHEIEELWDKAIDDYRETLKSLPKVVSDFYGQFNSCVDDAFVDMHDATVEVMPGNDHSSIYMHGDNNFSIMIDFDHDEVFHEMTSPPWMRDPKSPMGEKIKRRMAENNSEVSYHQYEEFHFDDGKLSYHFFLSNGYEWAFYNIRNLTWKKTNSCK